MCENYCRIQLLSQLKQRKTLELNHQQNLYHKIQEIVQRAKIQALQQNLQTDDCHIKPKFNDSVQQQSFRLPNFKQNKMKEIKYRIGHLKTDIQPRQYDTIKFNKQRMSRSIIVQREKNPTQNSLPYPIQIRGQFEISNPKKVIVFSQRNSPKKVQGTNIDTFCGWGKNSLDNSQY